jgi:hypothetical protein
MELQRTTELHLSVDPEVDALGREESMSVPGCADRIAFAFASIGFITTVCGVQKTLLDGIDGCVAAGLPLCP